MRNIGNHVVTRSLEDELKENYMRYSMSVIISRALPDVRDGLKPSQRRILYAMRQLNLGPSAKHRKCAKISGDTSGDYHPHGEQVIYPTLVRMAQSWSMRYPLVDGQGNFGSIDGDAPAAMRYTEAKMTSAAVLMMEDLDKDTVDTQPNYDETTYEPRVLPSKFPNLLANGTSGIAVGMATNIPSHNILELAEAAKVIIKNGEEGTSLAMIMKVMPGPDFATGGIICGSEGIIQGYKTGRGKILIRSKHHVEELSGNKKIIVIDEIPYNVNKSRLVEQIASVVENKQSTSISDIRDESDKDGVRVVIELKRGEEPEVVVNQLCRFTDFQVTFGFNLLVLDKGLPKVMGIISLINSWVDHRIEIIRRRSRFELNKSQERSHILEGFLKALSALDDIVRIIRSSKSKEEASNQLIEEFDFSKKQANSILELRLYQISALEEEKTLKEYEKLSEKITYLQSLLASEELIRNVIVDELESVKKSYPSKRRTLIEDIDTGLDCEDLIPNEQIVITISEDDYIKRMPINTFRQQKRGGQGVCGFQIRKEEDSLKDLLIGMTHDFLLLFTNFGRCYWVKCWQVTDLGRKSKGKPLVNLIEDLQKGERVSASMCITKFDEDVSLLLFTKRGVIKKTLLSSFSNKRRKGINSIVIDEGDELIGAKIVNSQQQIMIFTSGGMAVRFSESEVRAMGRVSRGVRGVKLKNENDFVVGCEVVNGDESILIICENGFGKRTNVSEFRHTSRGGIGVRSIITSSRNGLVVGALSVSNPDENLLIMTKLGSAIRIRAGDIRILGRTTQGVKLVNIKNNDPIIAVQKTHTESNVTQ